MKYLTVNPVREGFRWDGTPVVPHTNACEGHESCGEYKGCTCGARNHWLRVEVAYWKGKGVVVTVCVVHDATGGQYEAIDLSTIHSRCILPAKRIRKGLVETGAAMVDLMLPITGIDSKKAAEDIAVFCARELAVPHA